MIFTYEFEEVNKSRGKRIEATSLEAAEKMLPNVDDYLLMRVFYSDGSVLFDAWSGMFVELT